MSETYTDYDDRNRAIEALSEVYPKPFFVNGRQRRPLKHDIVKDIKADIARDPDSELKFYDIDDAVEWYCSHVGYQAACSVAGTARLDLKGNRAGTVTDAEARIAEEQTQAAFSVIEARKRARTASAVSAAPALAAPTPLVRYLQADATMNNNELLVSIDKHLQTFKML